MGPKTLRVKYKVGQSIKSGDGNEYVIARIYKWPEWLDLELINKSNGEYGTLRIVTK